MDAALWLPALADAALRRHFAAHILARGVALWRDEAVGALHASETGAQQQVEASVQGTRRYRVQLALSPGSTLRGDCSCPYASNAASADACKHQAALALAWRHQLGGDAQAAPTTETPAVIDSAAAARRRVAALFDALPPGAHASSLQALPALLQAWRGADAAWTQAGAELALQRLCGRLDRLQAAGAWAEGEADWQRLAQAVAAELLTSWSAQAAAPPAYAPSYLALLAGDSHGLVDAAQALASLGPALAERAGQLLCREWQQGAPATAYLEHLVACGDAAERLRVLGLERRDAADHAAYIAALQAAGRGREALAAAETAQRAHPEDGALCALLIAFYEQDGWDEEALALRRAQLRRDPDHAACLALLARAPDAEAERRRLDIELGQSAAGQTLRLRLWAEQGRWPEGLAWLATPAAAALPATAWADWLTQLPASALAAALPGLQQQVAARLARAPARPGAGRSAAAEQLLLQALLARLEPPAAALWLAWLRVEWRRRPVLLALVEAAAAGASAS